MNTEADPPYPFQHEGPVLAVGNAWCLHEDLVRAQQLFPSASIMAVNGAAREVLANFLFSYHPERFIETGFDWIRHQRRLFGNEFTVHGSRCLPGMPWVEFWWNRSRGGGGSIWGARKVLKLLGFDPVIICGSPMIAGPYTGNHNLGGMMHIENVVNQYLSEIASDTDWHKGCYSMSGQTREILGSLP